MPSVDTRAFAAADASNAGFAPAASAPPASRAVTAVPVPASTTPPDHSTTPQGYSRTPQGHSATPRTDSTTPQGPYSPT
ncbi:hypothetical protein LN042_35325, partial [Kitasatospora sp. RB6PN24]|nr:hypothetical protein [Kitasatospora humi]